MYFRFGFPQDFKELLIVRKHLLLPKKYKTTNNQKMPGSFWGTGQKSTGDTLARCDTLALSDTLARRHFSTE